MSLFRPKSELTKLLATRAAYTELSYTKRFSRTFLDRKAKRGDPLADALIARMAADGLLGGAWRDLIDVVIAEAPNRNGVYQEFVNRCYRVPEWASFKRMRPSQRMVFTRLPGNLTSGLVTFIGSSFVPSGLSAAASSQLVSKGKPRLLESATFILKPALGMAPGSIAHRELIRVRVIHAAIRYFMGKKRGQHPGDQLLGDDEYVNQSQMAFFLTSFSFVHLRTAVRLGMRLSDEQIDSHHHRWQYMGYLMGMDEDLLTETVAEEKELAHAVMKREVDPSLNHPFFLEMIEKMIANLGRRGGRSRPRDRARRFEEFRVMLVHALGEDFIGGWAGSISDVQSQRVLRRIKRKIALVDAVQRQRIVEVAQYNLVKWQFESGRKKLLLAIERADESGALGTLDTTPKPASRAVRRFRTIVDELAAVY